MPDSPPVIGPSLSIDARTEKARTILKALASEPRLRVLELLSDRVCNVSEIGEALGMPPSTATLHVTALEEAGLLKTELSPGARGLQKMCARAYDTILVQLPHGTPRAEEAMELSMPVGAYVDCQVVPTCGLVSETGVIGLLDDPASFYEPDRVDAQLLWFHHDYVEYRFPNRLPPQIAPDSIQLALEVCSEAPLHHDDWPSDITLWINRVEVGTWTSPRDFGGQRGALTPEWWEDWNSQYGLHKVWQVSHEGSFVDGLPVSAVCLDDLEITEGTFITVQFGVKPDARHVGGINIFGRKFGNYPQDIVMRLRYHQD
jgi:predicted transcriptional regulator